VIRFIKKQAIFIDKSLQTVRPVSEARSEFVKSNRLGYVLFYFLEIAESICFYFVKIWQMLHERIHVLYFLLGGHNFSIIVDCRFCPLFEIKSIIDKQSFNKKKLFQRFHVLFHLLRLIETAKVPLANL